MTGMTGEDRDRLGITKMTLLGRLGMVRNDWND